MTFFLGYNHNCQVQDSSKKKKKIEFLVQVMFSELHQKSHLSVQMGDIHELAAQRTVSARLAARLVTSHL